VEKAIKLKFVPTTNRADRRVSPWFVSIENHRQTERTGFALAAG